MRHLEIREAEDGFEFWCRAIPPEQMPTGWTEAMLLRRLTEEQAHRAGAFVRMNDETPLMDLYELTERHIGREPYSQ